MEFHSKNGGLAQLARAPALHAGGHRFDSDILHQGQQPLFPLAARYPGLGTRGSGQFIDILETKNTRKVIIKKVYSLSIQFAVLPPTATECCILKF